MSALPNSQSPVLLVAYDGQCPFCSAYVRVNRLHALDIDLQLIDLRQDLAFVESLRERGINPQEGIYAHYQGQDYFAEGAMALIGGLTSSSSFVARGFKWWFQSHARARFIYPLLKFGRGLALKILGRGPL